MVRVAAHGEQPAVNARMQRLDPPVQHLGALRDLGDVRGGDPRLTQGLRGAAGRDDLDALLAQGAGEIGKPCFVADRQQRAGNLSLIHAVYAAAGAASLRSACWPPSPVLMSSMFHTIRTSLASPTKPASTTCEVACGPRASARKKLSSILVSGAFELIFHVSPLLSVSTALCPSVPRLARTLGCRWKRMA